MSLDLEKVDVAELISRALKKFDLEFKQKNIHIAAEIE